MFSGFVILPVFWCITPELWQLLLLLSFHISSSLSTTLEIEIFCCRHFILVPSPRRPVNLPRRWENTTGLAIPFLKTCPCFRKHRNAQKYRQICSLYWLKNSYWICYSLSPRKICPCFNKHRNAHNTGWYAAYTGSKILLDLPFPFPPENLLLPIENTEMHKSTGKYAGHTG